MTKTLFRLFAMSLIVAGASAQTTKPATSSTTHTTATHHTVAAKSSACGVDLPTMSEKIPALDKTASKCPKVLYSLSYVDTVIGTGELALPHKWYTVHYTGYLADGTKFDSSVDRGEPITFPYGARQVIAGWDTGFEGMRAGGKRRLYIPYQLAYGEAGRPPTIPAKALLIFDVQFISQSDTPPAPKTPPVKPIATPAKPAVTGTLPARTTAPATTTTPATASPSDKPAPPSGASSTGSTTTPPDTKKPQ